MNHSFIWLLRTFWCWNFFISFLPWVGTIFTLFTLLTICVIFHCCRFLTLTMRWTILSRMRFVNFANFMLVLELDKCSFISLWVIFWVFICCFMRIWISIFIWVRWSFGHFPWTRWNFLLCHCSQLLWVVWPFL